MQRRELACDSDGTRLAGTLTLPDGDGPWPAIVTLHGSSSGRRDHRLFIHLEALLVPAGFGVMRYDRRGSGASQGDFDTAEFAQLAADALAVVDLLAGQDEVDPRRIGFHGYSQGGWIGPEAASRSRAVAFMVLVGACAVTPADQMRYATATALRGAGYDEADVEQALATRAVVDAATRGEMERSDAARDAFRDRHDRLTAVRLPGTGHFPTMARGAEGEEAAPMSPDYEALLLRWLRQLAPTV